MSVDTTIDERRGRAADKPSEIPVQGWKDVLARTKAEAKTDNVSLLAAGIAFFALLAIVPALVAFISIYGLIADPADVSRHVGDVLGAAPREVRELVQSQLESITRTDDSQAGLGAIFGVLIALWSASSGTVGETANEVKARRRRTGTDEYRPV